MAEVTTYPPTEKDGVIHEVVLHRFPGRFYVECSCGFTISIASHNEALATDRIKAHLAPRTVPDDPFEGL